MDLPATPGNDADRDDHHVGLRNTPARQLFELINKMVEPLVRLGFGSPNAGPGLVVVEATGHRTGLPRRVPLLGLRAAESVITTFRPNSTWVRDSGNSASNL